jgi:PhzF family phenazine biosynthesis protein
MPQPVITVDAFTNRPFAGNPAAVCLLPAPRKAEWMQRVAREMNLPETAFLCRERDAFRLRWFTPAVEVDLCGHATLASAHVLWQEGHLQPNETARFQTRSGLLTAECRGDWIELDFPATPAEPCPAPDELVTALGTPLQFVGRNRFDYLALVESEERLRRLRPDFALLAKLAVRGFIVTARSAVPEFDFVSRFFAPASGVPEDPVTGSSHCCLGPFWGERLGKRELRAYQASERGGVIGIGLAGERVKLRGQAVTVLRGELVG